MSYDDRYSRFGDSRIDDFWRHRDAQIDRDYATRDLENQARRDRWEVDARAHEALHADDCIEDPPRPSLGDAVDAVLEQYDRAKEAIRDSQHLSAPIRDEWLARLKAMDLVGRAGSKQVISLRDKVDGYREGPILFILNSSSQSVGALASLRTSLILISSELTLLACACRDLYET